MSVHHRCCDRIQLAWATAKYEFADRGDGVIAGFRITLETAIQETARAIRVETPGGRIQVRWDGKSAATPSGCLAAPKRARMLVSNI